MINRITICADGHMIPEYDCLGRTGEHNATVLKFDFFEDLNGKSVSDFQKELVAILPEGVLRYPIEGDFSVPEELTVCDELIILVEIKEDGELLFKSCPHIFTFIQTEDDPEVNVIQSAVDAAKKACCDDLASSLETVTGENQDGKTWKELNDTVATLSTITEEQVQALSSWDLIKIYFESYRGSSHHLFTMSPKDASGADKFYTLPYLYTPNMRWQANVLMFSTSLLEAGVDVSSAVNLGGSGTVRTFSPLPQLQRLTLTGNANTPSLDNFMYSNYELRYLKMETPSEAVLSANPSYYKRAFYRCERLESIDCELDFTGQMATEGMFTNCFRLKDLRIKPFTLATSLDLGGCRELRNTDIDDCRNIIAVLNAITKDQEVAKDMTITFSEYTQVFTQSSGSVVEIDPWVCTVYWNPANKMYTREEPPYIEGGEAIVELSLYSAFIAKGVTIAWK